VDEFGSPSLLDTNHKAFIILVKEIMKISNLRMAFELPLSGIERTISYKTVERLHSDPLVIMILNNLFNEFLRKK
jgi:transposase